MSDSDSGDEADSESEYCSDSELPAKPPRRGRRQQPLRRTKHALRRRKPAYRNTKSTRQNRLDAVLRWKRELQQLKRDGKYTQSAFAQTEGMPPTTFNDWIKQFPVLVAQAKQDYLVSKGGGGRGNARRLRSQKSPGSGPPPFFEKQEREVVLTIGVRNIQGLKVSRPWIRAQMLKKVKALVFEPGSKAARRQAKFTASAGWCARFMKRHLLVPRRRSCTKAFAPSTMAPDIARMIDNLRRLRLQTKPAHAGARVPGRPSHEAGASREWVREWGGIGPYCTYNIDQVPLPFVIDDGKTITFKGAPRVRIKQLGSGLDKRQFTVCPRSCFSFSVPCSRCSLASR